MKIVATSLPEVLVLHPTVYCDERGTFRETYRADRYRHAGLEVGFVQDNVSTSRPGVLRGLHLQHPGGQGKLITVLRGRILDVAVDVRRGSPRFGAHVARVLDAEEGAQFWIPAGFAHGFCVLGQEPAIVHYKCTTPYQPQAEICVRFDDDAIGIAWPLDAPIVSTKDRNGRLLSEIPTMALPPMP